MTIIAVGIFLLVWMGMTIQERRRHPGRVAGAWGPPGLTTPSMRALERLLEGCWEGTKAILTVVFWGLVFLGGIWLVKWAKGEF